MGLSYGSVCTLQMSEVLKQFQDWRKERRRGERLPKKLWKLAVDLANDYSLEEIVSTLNIDYGRLEKRIESFGFIRSPKIKRSPPLTEEFVEIGPLGAGHVNECTIETEDNTGNRLTIHLKDRDCAHAIEFAKVFWGCRS